MVQKRIRKFTIGLGVTAAVILLAAFALRRVDAAGQIKQAAFGLGQTTGQALTLPFAGLIQGISQGTGQITSIGGTVGADFQQFITGNSDN